MQTDSLPVEPQGKPKNTRVGSLSLLQRIFLIQESNWGLLHYKQILYQLGYHGSPLECIPLLTNPIFNTLIKIQCLSGLPNLNSPLRFTLGFNLGSVTLPGQFCQDSSDLPFVVVQSISHVRPFATPQTAACQAPLSFTISQSLLKLMSFEAVMPSDHLILGRPLLLPP